MICSYIRWYFWELRSWRRSPHWSKCVSFYLPSFLRNSSLFTPSLPSYVMGHNNEIPRGVYSELDEYTPLGIPPRSVASKHIPVFLILTTSRTFQQENYFLVKSKLNRSWTVWGFVLAAKIRDINLLLGEKLTRNVSHHFFFPLFHLLPFCFNSLGFFLVFFLCLSFLPRERQTGSIH